MGRWSQHKLDTIFDGASGKCHLCHAPLARSNHGKAGARGAWHVDHSRARARGGSDYLRNLKPACISCNCSKGDGSNRSVRAQYGKTRAPLSREGRQRARIGNTLGLGGLGWLLCRAFLGPGPAVLGAIVGAIVGAQVDPDEAR